MVALRWACVALALSITQPALAAERGTQLGDAMAAVVSVLPEWLPGSFNNVEPEGSGVVIFDGHTIMTALHVVAKARSIRVRTASGLILRATLKGRDRATDLAMLKVERRLPIMEFADGVHLGDRVCAIGNAFGLGLSLSCGAVSAVHRSGIGFNGIEDFVQTDAAVNPGASGGALITANNRLAGILSAIFTKKSDASHGVNFAVSAALVKRVATEMLEHARVDWRLGGVRLKAFPAKGGLGEMAAEVVMVRPGEPAEKAGLMTGDRIVSADGRRVRKPAEFRAIMALAWPARDVELRIVRNGDYQTLSINPGPPQDP